MEKIFSVSIHNLRCFLVIVLVAIGFNRVIPVFSWCSCLGSYGVLRLSGGCMVMVVVVVGLEIMVMLLVWETLDAVWLWVMVGFSSDIVFSCCSAG